VTFVKTRKFTMANKVGIFIDQRKDGTVTFTPDLPRATVNQPLILSSGDEVTWNNRTKIAIKLQAIQPQDPKLFPFESIPAKDVSNPIFQVPGNVSAIGYSWVRPVIPAPARAAAQAPAPPDHWILVV
jgi:hypothetical protein